MPNARATCATCPPIRPSPTTPIVLPRSSVPSNRLRSHSPRRIASAAQGMWRTNASSSPIACSAALTVFAPGAFITAMPRRVAAWTSIVSTPVPARATTWRRGARANRSAVTWVSLRTTSACAPATAPSRSSRALPLSQLEAGDGPTAPALGREQGEAALLAPRLHPLAHRIVASPACLDPALPLDAPELGLQRVEQRDRRRVGRLESPGRLLEGDQVEVESAIGQIGRASCRERV